jgi:6-phosphogluconolactonase (cycloisomerase 2 family)
MQQLTGLKVVTFVSALFLLAGCGGGGGGSDDDGGGGGGGGGGESYTIGGTVLGLVGTGLELQGNGFANKAVDANGPITSAALPDGTAYDITVKTQPTNPNQTCTVTNGSGTLAGADITNVVISCTTATYTIGGTVTGLLGTGTALVLQKNGGDNLSISADGDFVFATPVDDASTYLISVLIPPTGPVQTCTVNNNNGTVAGADVMNVAVICSINSFTIGGNVANLIGTGLVLQNSGVDDETVAGDGSFTFDTAQADGSTFGPITVLSQPTNPNQTCTVTANGTGVLSGSNVTNVALSCVTTQYTVGGNVTNLLGTGLELQNNGADDETVAPDGTFTFNTALDVGIAYGPITVSAQPTNPNQTCTVTANGSGNIMGANVTNVAVNCVTAQYTIGGTVNGLDGTGMVLRNNGIDDTTVNNGTFTFNTAVDDGSTYGPVTVFRHPSNNSQTCTVTAGGTGTVAGADVTNVVLDCVTASFTVGGTVTGLTGVGTLMLQNEDSGDTVSVTAPGGIFTFATDQLDGTGYGPVSVLTQPAGQTCTVTNPSGTMSGGNVTNVFVFCGVDYARFAYVANFYGASVSVFAIESNGDLKHTQTLPAGDSPLGITLDPTGQYAYASNFNGASVSQYLINADGSLTSNGTVGAGIEPGSVIVHPAGNWVYVPNRFDDTVSQYTINGDGTLAFNVNVGVGTGAEPSFIGIDPLGRFAYVANLTSGDVAMYTIDPTTGALTLIGNTLTVGTGPEYVAIDPTGTYVYVSNEGSNDVSMFSIDQTVGPTFGILTWLGNVAAGASPAAITIDPTGQFAYVANFFSGVTQYSINQTTGILTVIGFEEAPAGDLPRSIAVDPTGEYVYVTNRGTSDLHQYTINVDGTLALMQPPVTPGEGGPSAIAISAGTVPALAVPRHAYATNEGSANVSQYDIDAGTGALSDEVTSGAGGSPDSVAVDPRGRFAFVANFADGTLSQYTVNGDGSLSSNGAVVSGSGATSGPRSMAVDPSGIFAYVANFNDDTISQYAIDDAGNLQPMVPPAVLAGPVGTNPRSIGMGPMRRYFYVANEGDAVAVPPVPGSVTLYRINTTDGTLTLAPAVAAGTTPRDVTVDPLRRSVYVANSGSNNVSVYSLNDEGDLSLIQTAAAGLNPSSIAIDPLGQYAYVANFGGNTVLQYSIDAVNGTLTAMGLPLATGTGPTDITVDHSGRYVYVSNSAGVGQFSIGVNGQLTFIGSIAADTGPSGVATWGSYQ